MKRVKTVLTPMPQKTFPSAARVLRVEIALESEPAFRHLLDKTEKVMKRNGETLKVSQLSVEVATTLAAQGKDACRSSKLEILRIAKQSTAVKEGNYAPWVCVLLSTVIDLTSTETGLAAEKRKTTLQNLVLEYKNKI